jgi:hypothetical protein
MVSLASVSGGIGSVSGSKSATFFGQYWLFLADFQIQIRMGSGANLTIG